MYMWPKVEGTDGVQDRWQSDWVEGWADTTEEPTLGYPVLGV